MGFHPNSWLWLSKKTLVWKPKLLAQPSSPAIHNKSNRKKLSEAALGTEKIVPRLKLVLWAKQQVSDCLFAPHNKNSKQFQNQK